MWIILTLKWRIAFIFGFSLRYIKQNQYFFSTHLGALQIQYWINTLQTITIKSIGIMAWHVELRGSQFISINIMI